MQNRKNFRLREPFRFSNGRFFYPYETVDKYSNATFLGQILWQNLRHKNVGFSETDLDVYTKMQKSIPSLSIVMYKICQCVFAGNTGCVKKVYKVNETYLKIDNLDQYYVIMSRFYTL